MIETFKQRESSLGNKLIISINYFSCEILKDYKTGDSLCYGFVEFKDVESCEKAYFKMDNVLIDDRRIHVDFCQSVGKHNKNFKSKNLVLP